MNLLKVGKYFQVLYGRIFQETNKKDSYLKSQT